MHDIIAESGKKSSQANRKQEQSENSEQKADDKTATPIIPAHTPSVPIPSMNGLGFQEVPNPREIHHSISMLIKNELDKSKTSSSRKDVKDTIYAMAAIADEIFLNIDWDGKWYWEENMIESRFFSSQLAGDEIFHRIDALLDDNEPLSVNLAEVYIKMLSIGFKGKYRGLDDESIQIDTYRHKLFDFIATTDSGAQISSEHQLFQKEYTYTIPTIHRRLLPDAAIITYISAFFVFMFTVISSIVWMFETLSLKKLLHEVSSIALQK
jgi:type VI secretion system protein ImpK